MVRSRLYNKNQIGPMSRSILSGLFPGADPGILEGAGFRDPEKAGPSDVGSNFHVWALGSENSKLHCMYMCMWFRVGGRPPAPGSYITGSVVIFILTSKKTHGGGGGGG